MSKIEDLTPVITVEQRVYDGPDYEDVVRDVEIWTATQIAWEYENNRPFIAMMNDATNIRFTDLAWLVWRQDHPDQKGAPPFKQWCKTLKYCFLARSEEEADGGDDADGDPTQADPPTG